MKLPCAAECPQLIQAPLCPSPWQPYVSTPEHWIHADTGQGKKPASLLKENTNSEFSTNRAPKRFTCNAHVLVKFTLVKKGKGRNANCAGLFSDAYKSVTRVLLDGPSTPTEKKFSCLRTEHSLSITQTSGPSSGISEWESPNRHSKQGFEWHL